MILNLGLGATCFRTEWRARANLRRLLLRDSPGPLASRRRPVCRNSHLESCTPGTRQYKVVRTGTYQYILFWIHGGTRNVKIVHTSTYRYVRTHDISMAVHTGMYWYILYGTRRYEQVQGGTWWYKEQYKEVQDSMYWYVLVCTNPGPTVQPGPGMLPCGWIRCCNSARAIALYWRQVHLMTALQAQACFNQPLVRPTL